MTNKSTSLLYFPAHRVSPVWSRLLWVHEFIHSKNYFANVCGCFFKSLQTRQIVLWIFTITALGSGVSAMKLHGFALDRASKAPKKENTWANLDFFHKRHMCQHSGNLLSIKTYPRKPRSLERVGSKCGIPAAINPFTNMRDCSWTSVLNIMLIPTITV